MSDSSSLLGLSTDTWKLILSAATAVFGSISGALVYTLRQNETTWRNRHEEWSEREKFYQEENARLERTSTNEREERIAKEQLIERLKDQISELRDQKSDIIKNNLLETEAAILRLKNDLSTEVDRLKRELEEKDAQLRKLQTSQSQSLREVETLRAEVSIRNKVIEELNEDIVSLSGLADTNNQVAVGIGKAELDIKAVGRTRQRIFSRLSSLPSDIALTAERQIIRARDVQRGRAEQRLKAEMDLRAEHETDTRSAIRLHREFPED
jgi:chromosome segregation ATPase